jgi:membrane-bound lytic murein transglycosylase D
MSLLLGAVIFNPVLAAPFGDPGESQDPGVSTLKISYSLDSVNSTEPTGAILHDDLWERIRAGFAIDSASGSGSHELTATHERWYAARADYVQRTVDRGRPFLHYIVEQVEARGMPTELALLPMVESAFNTQAVSPARAAGIWQFIPGTARKFGLSLDQWYDGRRDVVEATRAALDYLEELHHLFGDWKLALAAYNCGEGCVQRAILKNRAAKRSTDYESLSLPTETRHYVPKLLAVKHIVSDPARFGLALDSIPNTPYFTQVTLAQPMDMRSAARLAGMSTEDLAHLNPGFHRQQIVRSDIPRQLLLPLSHADAFIDRLAETPVSVTTWKPYKGKKGEALADIARKHGVGVETLTKRNQLALSKGKLKSAQTVLVPVKEMLKPGSLKNDAALLAQRAAPAPDIAVTDSLHHVVQPGDTLYSLGKRYSLSVADLRDWNGLAEGDTLHPGQTLALAAPSPESLKTALVENFYQTEYQVKPGDTLSSIARHFKVGVTELLLWNGMSEHDKLRVGASVVLYPPANG